ncbi:MAG: hypothetical protein ACREJO_03825 [Phycisphaerales bacterium]
MRSRVAKGLIVTNALLLGALAVVTLQSTAQAQRQASTRPRGTYLLVAGKMIGGTSHAVYVLDTSNQELIGLRWDGAGQRLEPFGYRNVAGDSAAAGRGR